MDGEMVEGPLVRSARTIVQRYEQYAARDAAQRESAATRP
jgi:hypothetical protein